MKSQRLAALAHKYECSSFLEGDPSSFMHEAVSVREKEMVAFLASTLSFGLRKAFMGKIRFILSLAHEGLYEWVKNGCYEDVFKPEDGTSFYRYYSYGDMHRFFSLCRQIFAEYSTLGDFVEKNVKDRKASSAIELFSDYFNKKGKSKMIPKPTSACKRLCMFLRWMVRDGSQVDIGVWADKIDRSTLIIPLDVHVLRQASKIGLIRKRPSASMKLARELTEELSKIFPGDPCKGDFALFGLGVSGASQVIHH